MASACTLGPWQCPPDPIFRPRNFNIKIGPVDEANLEVDEPHEDGMLLISGMTADASAQYLCDDPSPTP